MGMYVDHDGIVYVADSYNHRIVKWRPGALSGELVASSQQLQKEKNQLEYVASFVVAKNGTMFVCDRPNRQVRRWIPDANEGEAFIFNISCSGMFLTENGFLYVVGDEKVIRWPGNEVVAGGNGAGPGLNQFSATSRIFVDQNEVVYVADAGNHRVVRWPHGAKEGILVASGVVGGFPLHTPVGVVVDQMGSTYVLEYGTSRITRWLKDDPYNGIVIIVDKPTTNNPVPLAPYTYRYELLFDTEGNLYAVDQYNHRIQKYQIDKSACL
ncbi:unnamed protein product [Rotaria sp. Silwood1]|nr:unnamed protein product [Rotaria sp. Silwood1]CAF1657660.1 unnamed protein product [Rotaria sp. Silwood1]CAF4875094.1 unnamed protein product [Rotaria sp. Silwood1]CAF4971502.1 unnamed protein product [Rotaria sp. Silwood1]